MFFSSLRNLHGEGRQQHMNQPALVVHAMK